MDQEVTNPKEKMEDAAPAIPEKDGAAKEGSELLVPEKNGKEGSAPSISEKDGDVKEGSAPSISEKDGDVKEGSAPLISEKDGDVKGATASNLGNAKEEQPLLPSDNKNEATCENMEVEDVPVPEQQEEERAGETNRPCGDTGVQQAFYGFAALICFIFGVVQSQKAADSKEHNVFVNNALVAVGFFLFFVFFMIAYFFYARTGFNPATIWGAASTLRKRNIHFRDGQVEIEDGDLENQPLRSTSSEYEEATDKQQTAGPSQPSTEQNQGNDSSSAAVEENLLSRQPQSRGYVTTLVTDIASSLCNIASETAKKDLPDDCKKVSTCSEEQNAESEEHNTQKDSNQDGSSSGELRRRKFLNPEDSKDATTSSDEEVKKESAGEK